ncbi:MAG: CopD family protein [Trueperaceae bacterium]
MTDLADALVRAAGYLASVALLAVPVARRLLPAEAWKDLAGPLATWARRTCPVVIVAGIVLLATSATEPVLTIRSLLGRVPFDLLLDFVRDTTSGRAVLVRAASALVLTVLVLRSLPPRSPPGRGATLGTSLAAVALFASFAYAGHAAVMDGFAPIAAAVVHMAAATVWVAAVALLAVLPIWRRDRRSLLRVAVARTSRIGVAAVATLAATGSYATTLHVGSWDGLTGTAYGIAWWVKIGAVLVTVGIAAVQRLHHLPALGRRPSSAPRPGFRTLLAIEAVVLAAVLLITSVLATRAPPH